MNTTDNMIEKINWWASWVKDEEVDDIRDVGRLVYRLEQHVRISDAEELLDWLTRMNKCIENEFTYPGPMKEEFPYDATSPYWSVVEYDEW